MHWLDDWQSIGLAAATMIGIAEAMSRIRRRSRLRADFKNDLELLANLRAEAALANYHEAFLQIVRDRAEMLIAEESKRIWSFQLRRGGALGRMIWNASIGALLWIAVLALTAALSPGGISRNSAELMESLIRVGIWWIILAAGAVLGWWWVSYRGPAKKGEEISLALHRLPLRDPDSRAEPINEGERVNGGPPKSAPQGPRAASRRNA